MQLMVKVSSADVDIHLLAKKEGAEAKMHVADVSVVVVESIKHSVDAG